MPHSSSSPDQGFVSPDRSASSAWAGAPGAVRLLCVLVAVEGVVLAGTGVLQSVQAFVSDHVMSVGAIVLMGLLYLGYGLWLLLAARSLCRGGLWPRALVLLTQVFLVVVCVQLVSLWSWWMAAAGIAYAVVTVLVLFAPAVQRFLLASHMAREATGPTAGAPGVRRGNGPEHPSS